MLNLKFAKDYLIGYVQLWTMFGRPNVHSFDDHLVRLQRKQPDFIKKIAKNRKNNPIH